MYLRCRGYRRPLAIEHLLGVWRATSLAALRPASQSEQASRKDLRRCQWISQSASRRAATAEVSAIPTAGHCEVSPQTKSIDDKAPSGLIRNVNVLKLRYVSFEQARHDLGVQSREDWERERYADQIAGLLNTGANTPPRRQNPRAVLYGKNKADKILVSQLLKDKGQTSYNWRIPLLQLEQYYKTRGGEGTPESYCLFRKINSNDPARAVYTKPYRSPILARDVPEPTSWSEASLSDYLADITDSQASQARIPQTLKPQHPDWSNVTDIAAIIYHLLRRNEIRNFMTVDACNITLRFFYKHSMFTRARAIYAKMEAMKMEIPAETFNIILRSAAVCRDLHNFTFLLHNMIQRGFQPDEVTWVSLLMAITSTAVRAVIYHKMKEKHMLEKPGIVADVAAQMIQHDLTFHLGNGHNFDGFLDHMDSRYGVRWLSTSAGNSLLNESSKRRSALETLDLLDGMKLRGFVPNEMSMDILLRKCLVFRWYKHAIEVLHTFHGQFDLHPGQLVYETLFIQAWKNRMLNFSRVVWRLACINGFVTFPMRKLVFRSILASVLEEDPGLPVTSSGEQWDLNRSQGFDELAGKFVIGVREPQESGLAELGPATSARKSDLTRRQLQQRQVSLHMKSDLLAALKFRSKVGLVELLRQALELDRQWARQGLWRKDSRQPDLRHGVQVELKMFRSMAKACEGEGSESEFPNKELRRSFVRENGEHAYTQAYQF
jgi:hypothetical protein